MEWRNNRLWLAAPAASLEQPSHAHASEGTAAQGPMLCESDGEAIACRHGESGTSEGCSRPSDELPIAAQLSSFLPAHPDSPAMAITSDTSANKTARASGLRGRGLATLGRCGDNGVGGWPFSYCNPVKSTVIKSVWSP